MALAIALATAMAIVPVAYLYRRLSRHRSVDAANPWLLVPASFAVAYGGGYVAAHALIDDEPGVAAVVAAAIVLGWAGILAGLALGGRVDVRRWTAPDDRRIVPPRWLIYGLIALGAAAQVVYFLRIGGVPLFMVDVEQARVDAAETGGGVLRTLGTLLLPGAWLAMCRAASVRGGYWRAGAAVLVAVGGQLLTANRSLAIVAAIVAVLIVLFVRRRGLLTPVQLGSLAGLLLMLVLAAAALGAYRYARSPDVWETDREIGRAVERGDWVALGMKAVGNYVVVPAYNLRLTMAAVPELIPHRLGYTWVQPVLTALPGRQQTFDADLKDALGQDYAGGGTVPGLVGEGWANFGWLGVVGWPALVGFVLMVLFRIAKARDTPAFWTLYAYALAHVSGGLVGGLFVASVFPFVAYATLSLGAWASHPARTGPPGPHTVQSTSR